MPSRRAPSSALENARKEAKRWLKALRANDTEARARLARAVPNAPAEPTLRDVQHALARERGFAGWAALKAGLTEPARIDDALVTRFLDNACPDHHVRGPRDHVRARHTAMRLLARHPAIARARFYTAVVCGDVDAVARMLAERPALATARDATPSAEREDAGSDGDLVRRDLGAKGWEPLLYLCFTRLPLPTATENAVAIATLLLDHGADPNAYFKAGGSSYTPLVGAVGEGEEDRPPHPQRDALVRLLLERGAEPYDIQVVYNLRFHADVLWFLELIHERSMALGRRADWDDPAWSMLDMGGYGNGARWHLDLAVQNGNVKLAEWCLAHGASPNPAPARDRRFPQRTVYEEALRRGETEIAELLARHGAPPVDVALDDEERFVAACLRRDETTVRALVAARPSLLGVATPMLLAAQRDRVDVVRFLVDLGMSPDVESAQKERALHRAAYSGAMRVAELLIERGAAIDPVESNWGNTPLAAAGYAQQRRMTDLLAPLSRDVWELTYAGKVDRLREVLAERPERARVTWEGHTPLMWLPPDDESVALEVATLLLAHGADPTLRNTDGITAGDRAERLGMDQLAELLRR